jgi:hypothetical protein
VSNNWEYMEYYTHSWFKLPSHYDLTMFKLPSHYDLTMFKLPSHYDLTMIFVTSWYQAWKPQRANKQDIPLNTRVVWSWKRGTVRKLTHKLQFLDTAFNKRVLQEEPWV